jgi:hypothetical protein
MRPKRIKIAIGIFLVLGTLLSLYIAIDGIANSSKYVTLIYRTGIFGYFIILDFLLIFPILGLTSIISYFTKGKLWNRLTKAVIVNIYFWFAFFLISLLKTPGGFECFVIVFILLASWGLACLWKGINSMN